MKSWVVHYKNKFPGSRVSCDDSKLDVYSADGEHLVAARKNGSGQWIDCSHELGCLEKHCLEPIPRDGRVYKLMSDDRIALDDQSAARVLAREEFCSEAYGYKKLKSMSELKAEGYSFDSKGDVVVRPAQA